MAKIAIFVPHAGMRDMAAALLQQSAYMEALCIEYLPSEYIEQRTQELKAQGCDLILARGLHARLARRCSRLPVVDIRVTAQELGTLLTELRDSFDNNMPKIGLIGFSNTLCNTDHFPQLFQVDLVRYTAEYSEQLQPLTRQALADGCQAVIGGQVVCAQAEQLGLPYRFLPYGEEGVREALETAERVCYAIDQEKANSAEMNTMLDVTFSGILQIDSQGLILRANRTVFHMLNLSAADVVGRPIREVLPGLLKNQLDQALVGGEEIYASLLTVQEKTYLVNIAPIVPEHKILGAILTFQESGRILEMETELRRELYRRGFIAEYRFPQFLCGDPQVKKMVDTARRIAKFQTPILLTGEPGVGKNLLAQCIHNESLARSNAFVQADCSAYQPENLDTLLFGNYTTRKDTQTCLCELAQDGTLYLSHLELLPPELQFKLLELLQGRFTHNGSNRPIAAHVRVIASATAPLLPLVQQGQFRQDLYYALQVLHLELPPLRDRSDAGDWIIRELEYWQNYHQRYLRLTSGAMERMKAFRWPGNLTQLCSFCEQIVLLAKQRSVDEVFISRQLEQADPQTLPETGQVVLFRDQKATEIAQLLRQHNGNRQKVADALGISKTTLWRYMKKFGIAQDFSLL